MYGIWWGASKVFGQVPPPATSICIIMPSLCQGGEEPPPYTPPEYVVEKTPLSPPMGTVVKPGDRIKYKVKVTRSKIEAPVAELALSCLTESPVVGVNAEAKFSAVGGDDNYTWSSGGDPNAGTGSSYSTKFSGVNYYTVVVSSGEVSAQCVVNVIDEANAPESIDTVYSVVAVDNNHIYVLAKKEIKTGKSSYSVDSWNIIYTDDGGNNWNFNKIEGAGAGDCLHEIDAKDGVLWAVGNTCDSGTGFYVGSGQISNAPYKLYKYDNNKWSGIGSISSAKPDLCLSDVKILNKDTIATTGYTGCVSGTPDSNTESATFRSSDGGNSWSAVDGPYADGHNINSLAFGDVVSPGPKHKHYGSLYNIDSNSLTEILAPSIYHFMSLTNGYFFTENGGANWADYSKREFTFNGTKYSCSANNTGGNDGCIGSNDISLDGDNNSIYTFDGIHPDQYTSIAGKNDIPTKCTGAPGIAGCEYLFPKGIYKTSDKGSTWRYLTGNIQLPDGAQSISPSNNDNDIDNVNDSIEAKGSSIWAIGDKYRDAVPMAPVIVHSGDDGGSWDVNIYSEYFSFLDISASNSTNSWIVGNGYLMGRHNMSNSPSYIGKIKGNGTIETDVNNLKIIPGTNIYVGK